VNWISIVGAVVFFLGVLASVALHEIGHMAPAKLFGVKVTQYFVGFGKTLWSTRKGETEYGIKIFPFGGFVRMIGMFPPAKDGRMRRGSTGPFQTLMEEARRASAEEVPQGEEHRLFYTKKWWQKVIIMAGGPMMNIILAVLMFAIVLMGFGVYTPKLVVADVPDCVIPVSANRTVCAKSDPASPAKLAGLHAGDKLLAFNGTKLDNWDQLSSSIREAGKGAATIQVERAGKQLTLNADLISTERRNPDNPSKIQTVGFLGVSPEQVREQQSVGAVFGTIGNYTSLTVQAMANIPHRMVGVAQAAFGGERAQDSPMSVIGASRVAGEIAAMDEPASDRIAAFVQWLGALNLFIALFNFIPLLPLDGGHIAGALFEAVRRAWAKLRGRPDPGYVDVARLLPIAYAAASVIMVMGVLLLYADIVNPVRLSN
jgi:membrane-associated protease RseP (regulator of RpoE activity)